MAKSLQRIRGFFQRKPFRFFSLILLYLSAGSLAFLYSGFNTDDKLGSERGSNSQLPSAARGQVYLSDARGFGTVRRVFEERRTERRFITPWMKRTTERGSEGGQRGSSLSRSTKGQTSKDADDEKAKYMGCYVDSIKNRALSGPSLIDYKKMTVARCQDNCEERGYMYAGLEFGAECYCSHRVQSNKSSETECQMNCTGNPSLLCGGANRLSVYRLKLSQESARRHGSALLKGCFHRPDDIALALPVSDLIQNMSVDRCVDVCTQQEQTLAALAGERCHCGLATPMFPLRDMENEDKCLERCAGEEYESCGNDNYFVVYQTQIQDKRCLDQHFLPSKAKELVALASFPGSGNTWTRHLIELATGYYTGSYYFDTSLYNKGFKGEKDHWESRTTICVKTHENKRSMIDTFDGGAIFLMRNPYRALVAEFNRQHSSHTGFASLAVWKGDEWPKYIKVTAPYWASLFLDWLNYGKKIHVVYYEDLKRDPVTQLRGVIHFLGLEVSEERLLCLESQLEGKFKRPNTQKLDYDPFTPAMKEQINKLITTVDDALKKKNLTGLPDEYMQR
ncbi:sialate:O-sulfotransferase 2 [Nelusetta ayraudi]|uniref:sialate:O-sulfotransferase 2 n=1 Tax=Nelusetta ayraudi TaxID=303726 RepID=UPI003F726B51